MNYFEAQQLRDKRSKEAYLLRQQGLSFRLIGERLGVAMCTARALVWRQEQTLKDGWGDHWSDGLLSVRAANILNNLGLESKESVMEAFKTGALSRWKGYHRPRMYGWTTYCEIARVLGLPKPKKRELVCAKCGKLIEKPEIGKWMTPP